MKRKPSPHYANLAAQVEKLIAEVKELKLQVKALKSGNKSQPSDDSPVIDMAPFIAKAHEIDPDLIPVTDLMKKYGFKSWATVVNILRNVQMTEEVEVDGHIRTFTHKVNGDFWLRDVVNNAEYRPSDGRLMCKEASESGKKMGTFSIPRNWVRSEIKSYRG
nr:MAG TPA: hypothetical protein [Caudoviricetes sp.]